ncbi:benzoate 1,2-dioxygenase electron transfer component BenC [Rhodoblastus sp. 17X3]|uniref:benzoate 1,2-dioxygenase electron transfer component BenC n=1 Tax=Rhodoblastus sp. 17X3 TaxID=3047026 RepID=UPI0024B65F03|nr:benzoate 1,2-dioxygenase electron transfer component BenC [Rhodoblastus sp. 17X3]MDI9848865.1 benzoate 1,2-dioxygenase electron transfer component BenC [Rhodoblastus sp. 17X3]
MAYNIALQFEDGVTRIVSCEANELVSDAAFRARINIPLDCRDGACGTCKGHCESGDYTLGDYIEDALTEDEAATGYVLTCQMRPLSDCVVKIPVDSSACKIEIAAHEASISRIGRDSPTTVTFSLQAEQPVAFLPGQYVNLQVPGRSDTRAYSFSSAPNQSELSFLIRDVPDGLMSRFMRETAAAGDRMTFIGPYGSFYLRKPERPILMLAGGTGLAPFLSMLLWLKDNPTSQPIRLAYGVNCNADLVELEALDELKKALPDFSYFTVVVDKESGHEKLGYVTNHLTAADLNGGDVDIYVCGPPPMVEGVRHWCEGLGVTPKNFLFEKFSATHEAAK